MSPEAPAESGEWRVQPSPSDRLVRRGRALVETGVAQALRLVRGAELAEEDIDAALHHRRDIARVELDAVVGDAVLWVVIGPDLLAPLSGADLGAPSIATLGRQLCLLDLVESGAQYRHCLELVLQLALFVLAGDHQPGRQVSDAHGGVGRVDALAAVTGRAV